MYRGSLTRGKFLCDDIMQDFFQKALSSLVNLKELTIDLDFYKFVKYIFLFFM